MKRILEKEHLDYILKDSTMELWAGLTMKDRCRWFSVRFPQKKMSVNALERLYKGNRVRKKAVRVTKDVPAPEKHKV